MSYLLPHLHSGWAVDQAILAEEERLVVIRFGHDWDETCMQVFISSIPYSSIPLSQHNWFIIKFNVDHVVSLSLSELLYFSSCFQRTEFILFWFIIVCSVATVLLACSL